MRFPRQVPLEKEEDTEHTGCGCQSEEGRRAKGKMVIGRKTIKESQEGALKKMSSRHCYVEMWMVVTGSRI